MRRLARFVRAWREDMTPADRARIWIAAAFPFGAISHMGWVLVHGWLYYGPAPPWAVVFWYTLCVADFAIAWVLLTRPRLGLVLALVTMAYTLVVNWTQLPTFEHQFNYILLGLTAFGVLLAGIAPWLWRRSTWRLADLSLARASADADG